MSAVEVERAVKIVGSQRALADGIRRLTPNRPKFSQQTISYWIKNDTPIDAEYWPAFEALTDNQVTRQSLRPEIFPVAEQLRA